MLGGAGFSSVTYRLFKLPEGLLEEGREDYGQAARYLVSLHRSFTAGYLISASGTALTVTEQALRPCFHSTTG